MMLPKVLTVSGFDPSAGAGLLADIKVFQSSQVYGFGVITALTTQNESVVRDIRWIPMKDLMAQIDILFEAHVMAAVKIGVTQDQKTFCGLVEHLRGKGKELKVIWDPVLRSSSGFNFWKDLEFHGLRTTLDQLDLITPNREEYGRLWGNIPLEEVDGKVSILVKSRFKEKGWVYDHLKWKGKVYEFRSKELSGYDKHGTGCVLSSGITAGLAQGLSIIEAYHGAKKVLGQFLISSNTLLGHLNN